MCQHGLSTTLSRLGPSVAISLLQQRVGFVASLGSKDGGVKRLRMGQGGCHGFRGGRDGFVGRLFTGL